jgi:hypothetical protein
MIHKTIALAIGVALVVGAFMYGAPAALAIPPDADKLKLLSLTLLYRCSI